MTDDIPTPPDSTAILRRLDAVAEEVRAIGARVQASLEEGRTETHEIVATFAKQAEDDRNRLIDAVIRIERQAERDRAEFREAILAMQRQASEALNTMSGRLLTVAESVRDSVAVLAAVQQRDGQRISNLEIQGGGTTPPASDIETSS